jgi:hypothetical protein
MNSSRRYSRSTISTNSRSGRLNSSSVQRSTAGGAARAWGDALVGAAAGRLASPGARYSGQSRFDRGAVAPVLPPAPSQ